MKKSEDLNRNFMNRRRHGIPRLFINLYRDSSFTKVLKFKWTYLIFIFMQMKNKFGNSLPYSCHQCFQSRFVSVYLHKVHFLPQSLMDICFMEHNFLFVSFVLYMPFIKESYPRMRWTYFMLYRISCWLIYLCCSICILLIKKF